MNTDAIMMARALRLAERGMHTTHPNPRVGSVILAGGEIVGEGFHLRAGEGHAEANALHQAGSRAAGATVYVTLEPCSFEGRTPSCARALIDAGVKRVVAAMADPDPRNAGKGFRLLRDAGIEVMTPMMESSARALNPGHVKRHETGLPFVRLKLAMSLDGRTALASGESKWITGPAARRDVQKWRARSGAIVTGVQTVIDDDPALTVRADELNDPYRDVAAAIPRYRVVLDPTARTPPNARLLGQSGVLLVCRADADVAPFRNTGNVDVLRLPSGADGRIALEPLLARLAARECSEILFECGPTLAGNLVGSGLLDELVLYAAPVMMGADARGLLAGTKVGSMQHLNRWECIDMRHIGEDFRFILRPAGGQPTGKDYGQDN